MYEWYYCIDIGQRRAAPVALTGGASIGLHKTFVIFFWD